MGQRYSDKEKASTLAVLDANGGNVSLTSKQTGIPRKTLEGWAKDRGVNEDVADLRLEVKRDFLGQLQLIKGLAADQIVARIAEFEPRDLTGLLKITAELSQLLSGEPTERTEHTGSVALTDARAQLERKFNSLASRSGSAGTPERPH